MSPEDFRRVFFPGMQAQANYVHSYGMPHLFHSCGNNGAIWEMYKESGIDAYQAIQDEEPLEDLKRIIGDGE